MKLQLIVRAEKLPRPSQKKFAGSSLLKVAASAASSASGNSSKLLNDKQNSFALISDIKDTGSVLGKTRVPIGQTEIIPQCKNPEYATIIVIDHHVPKTEHKIAVDIYHTDTFDLNKDIYPSSSENRDNTNHNNCEVQMKMNNHKFSSLCPYHDNNIHHSTTTTTTASATSSSSLASFYRGTTPINIQKDKHTIQLCSILFDIESILSNKDQTLSERIPGCQGKVIVSLEQVIDNDGSDESNTNNLSSSSSSSFMINNSLLRFQLRGYSLLNPRMQLFGTERPDCYYEIRRKQYGKTQNSWAVVHRSYCSNNTLNPLWDECIVNLKALCNSNVNREIRISIYDFDNKKAGKRTLIGSVDTTVMSLINHCSNRGNCDRDMSYKLCCDMDDDYQYNPRMKRKGSITASHQHNSSLGSSSSGTYVSGNNKSCGELVVVQAEILNSGTLQPIILPSLMIEPTTGWTASSSFSSAQQRNSLNSTTSTTRTSSITSQGSNYNNTVAANRHQQQYQVHQPFEATPSRSTIVVEAEEVLQEEEEEIPTVLSAEPIAVQILPPPTTTTNTPIDNYLESNNIRLCIGIDFTSNNGSDIKQPSSLHNQSSSDYEFVLKCIGEEIINKYGIVNNNNNNNNNNNSSNGIPVWGFGGSYNKKTYNIFQCGSSSHICGGIEGIIDAYHTVFRTGIELLSSHPIYDDIITAAASNAKKEKQQQQQQSGSTRLSYTLLVILTTGSARDILACKKKLELVSSMPMSILFIKMNRSTGSISEPLDGSKIDSYLSNKGHRPFCNYMNYYQGQQQRQQGIFNDNNILKGIEQQIITYFTSRGLCF